ncbi:MAG: hypothetical protein A3C53_00155 [Omnitrophica WOR_2 bacterium RIFCSPHIGHO2_02_FULL_68_15]|nr:MAG: hypothetical protein A3C53_00155 [Omnitrophica WOR_2 bacterium RIFCSPHIGHO2_02_FULL_68_15]
MSPKRFMMRSESEPWLVPSRIARPKRRHFSTSGVNTSSIRASSSAYCASVYSCTANRLASAKLPGLMRTFSTCSAASSAEPGLKWMSATSGTGHPLARRVCRIACRALASVVVGAVIRTISQPAPTRASDCRTVASTSRVVVVVMDWTRTGWPPPTRTGPMATSRLARRREEAARMGTVT